MRHESYLLAPMYLTEFPAPCVIQPKFISLSKTFTITPEIQLNHFLSTCPLRILHLQFVQQMVTMPAAAAYFPPFEI